MLSDIKGKLSALGLLWLRVLTGAGIAYHGYGKVFGGFMPKMIEGVTGMGFPMPHVFAWAAALSEFLGGILLVLGLGTRIAAFFILCTMSVAFFVAHKQDPLQVKELAAAYGTVALALILTGPGPLSLDRFLCKKK